ncbi:MAG: alkaline phosphatase family protein, partial [Vallitaleaceae bacterium]|nr:alkaline phosphatase family protein [Vallitaleaceae bacterium]
WPVMADAPIRYNCPEIWSVVGESYISLYLKHASKRALPIIFKNASKSKGKEQPYLDNFVESIVLDLIAKKKPNLLTAHLIELDHERHVSGLHEPVTYDILRRLDQRVGRILEATKKAGIYDKTDFVLLGDHGGTNFSQVVYMNTLFEEAGFIQIDQNRSITSWKVYANSCGGSTHIHFHPTCDRESKEKIIQLLHTLSAKPDSFIKHLYTKAEVQQKYHLSGDFEYVIEPKDGFVFHGEVAERGVIARNEVANCFVADHGHEPTHPDLKTILFAKGPRIQKGVVLEKACIVDEGPTFAAILGLEMKAVDGSILNALIKKF